jgi:hypothetical protein
MSGFGYLHWSYDPFEKMVISPLNPLPQRNHHEVHQAHAQPSPQSTLGTCDVQELHRLAQGKVGTTVGINTIFFLSHGKIRCIPKDHTVTYAHIVIDHLPQKDDPNHVRITIGRI